jgi:hypothetical protein
MWGTRVPKFKRGDYWVPRLPPSLTLRRTEAEPVEALRVDGSRRRAEERGALSVAVLFFVFLVIFLIFLVLGIMAGEALFR